MLKTETLQRWLERTPKGCSEYVLIYVTQDDGEDEVVYTWKKTEHFNSVDGATFFAEEIIGRCQNDCDNRELVCSYIIRAISAKGKHLASRKMRTMPTEEPADPLGIGSQQGATNNQQMVRVVECLLRHQNAMIKTFQESYQQIINRQQQQIQVLQKREEEAVQFSYSLIQNSVEEKEDVQKTQIMNKLTAVADKVTEHVLSSVNPKTPGNGQGYGGEA